MTKLLALCLLALPAFAQQTTYITATGIVAHVVDGDGWKTAISLNNIDPTPSQYKLSFFAENGAPLSLQTNFGGGSVFTGTIPARGAINIQTAGTNVALTQGWAKMETLFFLPNFTLTPGANVSGTVLFSRPPAAGRSVEVSEPIDVSLGQKWVLPFDHLNGYSSGVALVNPDSLRDDLVFITFYDSSGNQIGSDSIPLAKGTHVSFTLTQKYSQTIGVRGTVRIEASGAPFNVLGFHVSPDGTFTSTSPTSWE